ncbi:UNVERIFIED_ORG: HKD family nuclease [Sphingomonas sp. R1F5B]
MRLIVSPSELSAVLIEQIESCEQVSFATAWASTSFDGYKALKRHEDKIATAVVGTHFYQTDPKFIEHFASHSQVRFIPATNGVFHPKVYFFEHKAGKWACLMGSANFTAGGFEKNLEACLLITQEQDSGGKMLTDIKKTLIHYWEQGKAGHTIDLDGYERLHRRFAKKLAQAAGVFGAGEPGLPLANIELLSMDWRAFEKQVQKRDPEGFMQRMKVLAAARLLFSGGNPFDAMTEDERCGIAGLRDIGKVPWQYFGGMKASVHFPPIVKNNPLIFSKALDEIPLDRPVTRKDFLAYVKMFVSAFKGVDGRDIGHGLGTATRLLSMKRPDTFVCLNGPNGEKLFEEFGIKLHNKDYQGYWDQIIVRIQLSEWWNAQAPKGALERQIWNGRTALIDLFFYDPDYNEKRKLKKRLAR